MYGATLTASKFVLRLCPLFLKRGAAGSMKAREAGKSEAQKAQWDLGTEVGVFGTVELLKQVACLRR